MADQDCCPVAIDRQNTRAEGVHRDAMAEVQHADGHWNALIERSGLAMLVLVV
ncbi:MAG: hypothetical protein ABSE93_18935 [Terriglobia bacterium]